jgi:glycosyltransferase involved in cell wall biosynthesis
VGYVTATLDPGGSEKQMIALAERLPKDEFETTFLLFRETGALLERARASGSTVVGVAADVSSVDRGQAYRAMRGVRFAMGLASTLRRIRLDIVDAWLFHAYVAAGLTRPVTRIPALVAGRRSLPDSKGARTPFDGLLMRAASRSADVIVANSEAVRRASIEIDSDDRRKLQVIRNGVEIPPPMAPDERSRIRAGWGLGEQDVVVASVANYKPRKGLEELIDAVAELMRDGLRPALVLIGEGSSRASLLDRARQLGVAERVRLVGYDSRPEWTIAAADIAVHASESEGLPNAVLEAAAAGRPIVATDVGGTPEIIADGLTGLLVSPGQAQALSGAVATLIRDLDLRQRLGAAAQVRMATEFSMDRMVAGFARLYRDLEAAGAAR